MEIALKYKYFENSEGKANLQCDGEKCAFTFHVICGQIYGLIACWKDMQTGKRENDEE